MILVGAEGLFTPPGKRDDPLLAEIAALAGSTGDEFGKELGDEDDLVCVLRVTVVGDGDGRGIAANDHGPDDGRERVSRISSRVEDGNRALGVVGHVEEVSVRRQGAAPGSVPTLGLATTL